MRPVLVLAASLLSATSGCTALVEGTLSGRGGVDAASPEMDVGPLPDMGPMVDSGPSSPCAGMADGIRCSVDGIDEPFVCIGGICQLSRCGDGARDDRSGSSHTPEVCDDGNDLEGDGCDEDCTFSCTMASECDDSESCNGDETCDAATHACTPGTDETDLTPCVLTGATGVTTCHGGVCRAGACPDGNVDSGEDCDPATPMPDDGCDDDCTFTCIADADCQDGNLCNGNETCDVANHLCMPPVVTSLMCDDSDPCTDDTCDMTTGCVFTSRLVDADHDTFFAPLSGCGGDDCDDSDPARYPGADELCGGTVDNNCDMMVGMPPSWYRDCDGDHYAAAGATATVACTMPSTTASCVSWTQTAPTTLHTNQDCLDSSLGGTTHPGVTTYYPTSVSGQVPAYDYNCSGSATRSISAFDNTTSPNPPSPLPTRFVTCHVVGDPGSLQACTGDPFWRQTSAPACGATGMLAQCRWGIFGTCGYVTATATAACH